VEAPEDHRDELRQWLRLFTCTTLIEGEIRTRLLAKAKRSARRALREE
jgi:hypothetical protein